MPSGRQGPLRHAHVTRLIHAGLGASRFAGSGVPLGRNPVPVALVAPRPAPPPCDPALLQAAYIATPWPCSTLPACEALCQRGLWAAWHRRDWVPWSLPVAVALPCPIPDAFSPWQLVVSLWLHPPVP